ncbi:MAG: AMP-binding protein, partial [Bacillota bacterium]
LPTCEVKIIDEEICVKGDIVMLGYYKNDEATKESMSDGYFHTGDLGYLDEDGFLFITGRKKNLIILSNGKNINPEELENKLETIKGIREVIVFEEKDSIVAEVFADETVENAESVVKEAVEELNKTLPTFKQIGDVQFRATEFPKTSTKKIKRNR